MNSRVEHRIFRDGRYVDEPLGDKAVVRFHLTEDVWIDVRIVAGALELHFRDEMEQHRMAVRPIVSNEVAIILVPREE